MTWRNLSRGLLLASMPLALVVICNDASFAQANGDESATMRAVDQAVRAGNFGRAATLLQESAEAGSAEAQYQLASLYRSGRGVPQDERLAFKWMKAAAEKITRMPNSTLQRCIWPRAVPRRISVKPKSGCNGRLHADTKKLRNFLAEVSGGGTSDLGVSNAAQSPAPAEGHELSGMGLFAMLSSKGAKPWTRYENAADADLPAPLSLCPTGATA